MFAVRNLAAVSRSQYRLVVVRDGARSLNAVAANLGSKETLIRRQLRALPPSQAPKKPPNAFALFVKTNFEQVGKVYNGPKDGKAQAITLKLAELWKSAPENTKTEYTNAAKTLREKYVKERKVYEANFTPTQAIVETRRNALKRSLGRPTARVPADPNRPKRPTTSYMLFARDMQAASESQQKSALGESLGSLSVAERGHILGKAWRSLDAKVKQRYIDTAEAELKVYKKEIEAYNGRTKVGARRKELSRDLRRAANGPSTAKTGSRRPVAKKAKTKKPKVVKKTAVKKKVAAKAKTAKKTVAKKTGSKATVKKVAKKN
ncbi:high mobility group box domain-containing protein [Cladochytrium replicatum]|nr:high mobility group box domain-containing protein [Cladochytrium replicatum]